MASDNKKRDALLDERLWSQHTAETWAVLRPQGAYRRRFSPAGPESVSDPFARHLEEVAPHTHREIFFFISVLDCCGCQRGFYLTRRHTHRIIL